MSTQTNSESLVFVIPLPVHGDRAWRQILVEIPPDLNADDWDYLAGVLAVAKPGVIRKLAEPTMCACGHTVGSHEQVSVDGRTGADCVACTGPDCGPAAEPPVG